MKKLYLTILFTLVLSGGVNAKIDQYEGQRLIDNGTIKVGMYFKEWRKIFGSGMKNYSYLLNDFLIMCVNKKYLECGPGKAYLFEKTTKRGKLITDFIGWKSFNNYRLIRIDDWDYTLNHVGNYYSAGRNVLQNNTAYYGTNNGLIYENDNFYDTSFNYDDWAEFQGSQVTLPTSSFTNTPFTYNNAETLNILSNTNLITQVLPDIGSYKYINDSGNVVEDRDSIDEMAINDIINKVQRTSENIGDIRDNFTVSDIPTSNNTRSGNFYQSNSHIPESYLVSRGITGNSTIHNDIQASGYTLLEEYVNQVDE